MGFKITRDIINRGELNEKKTASYEGGSHKFRLMDDDRVTYFVGVCDEYGDFSPLDWASGRFGATTVQYFNEQTKQLETL